MNDDEAGEDAPSCDGDVRPKPLPVAYYLGRPVYKIDDLQYLDFPYIDEKDDENSLFR